MRRQPHGLTRATIRKARRQARRRAALVSVLASWPATCPRRPLVFRLIAYIRRQRRQGVATA